jgi:hypothetical protein
MVPSLDLSAESPGIRDISQELNKLRCLLDNIQELARTSMVNEVEACAVIAQLDDAHLALSNVHF